MTTQLPEPPASVEMIGRIIEASVQARTSRSLDVALDGLLDVGRIIGLPNPTFIDNVVHERHHEELHACLGLPREMLRWWRAETINAKQRDVLRTRQERMPFVSTLLDGTEADLSPLDRSLREVHRQYGIASNIIVPVHLPGGVTSLVGWTSTEAGAAWQVSEGTYGALLAVAYSFIDTLEAHKGSPCSAPARERLSNRERECLRHVAAGYSMKEVAKALALSPYTVREYLGNASRRLGARSLPQLVSLAWQRGEIDGDLPVGG
ncbi:LuxR family transcriptional regulatory, chaperone HchA-associated [compost metagenome]